MIDRFFFFFANRLHARDTCEALQKDMTRRTEALHEIEQTLPRPNGMYLSIILGNVNVSILNKNDKLVSVPICKTQKCISENTFNFNLSLVSSSVS